MIGNFMRKLEETICLDDEVNAIAAYIRLKWSPLDNLEQLVQDVRVAAEHAARAFFDEHAVWEVTVAADDAREAMLTKQYGDGRPTLCYYDAGCQLINNIRDGLHNVRAAALEIDGAWDYERSVDKVLFALQSKYPDLIGSRPIGWDRLEAGYNDFDGQEEFDGRGDQALFQGTKVESVGSGDFVIRTALPYVMYDEKCQGRKAHYVLVGAIFSQFLLITEHLNTHKACRDLEAVVSTLPQEHVFELAIEPQTPVLKTLIKQGKPYATRLEYEEAVAQVAVYDALSDAEKAFKRTESEASMAAFMDELTKPSARKSYKEHQAEKDLTIEPIKVLLKEALGETIHPGADSSHSHPRMRA